MAVRHLFRYFTWLLTAFADMPAYELYVDFLRRGSFEIGGKQLRVVVGKDRNTIRVVNL